MSRPHTHRQRTHGQQCVRADVGTSHNHKTRMSASVSPPAAKRRKASLSTQQLESAERRILSICEAAPGGTVQQQVLHSKFTDHELMGAAVNSLLSKGRLIVAKHADGRLVFRVQSAEDAAKFSGLNAEERLIYQEVERSGNAGISTKELRGRANMQHQQVAKVLKKLEARKLVQPVKSVTSKNKKMYIVHGLEPSRELTGGSWYSGSEFDHELIRMLQQVTIQYIQKEEKATGTQVHRFICQSGLIRGKQPALPDIQQVLRALIYDGKVEQIQDTLADSDPIYRLSPPLKSVDELLKTFTSVPPLTECDCATCMQNRTDQPCAMLSAWLEQSTAASTAASAPNTTPVR